MKLFIGALGASAGGGLTYLWNVLPQFASYRNVELTVLADEAARLSTFANATAITAPQRQGPLQRFLWEQSQIPKLVRKIGADVLLCTGNFAVWNSPVPQIVLSRNSLYTSSDFIRDLKRRGEYRLLLETRLKGFLARRSIKRAELTIAPCQAFARELETWSGRQITALYHGFDRERFFDDQTPLPLDQQQKLHRATGTVNLLFVSHYNYYRNFETLLKGVALLKERLPGRKVRLVLTCEFSDKANPGNYRTEEARALLRKLNIEEDVVQLGTIAYSQLHHVYHACDVYVTSAYTETFAHPLVEAMASGLPIVASDIAVHREITGGAALVFDRFSPQEFADRVIALLGSPSQNADIKEKGLRRAEDFSWRTHVERLLEIARELTRRAASR